MLLAANFTAWLTPIWLLGAGCLVGLAVLAALYGLVNLLWSNGLAALHSTFRAGFLIPVTALASILALFALVSLFLSVAKVGYLPIADITRSLARLPYAGSFTEELEVPAVSKTERTKPVELQLRDFRPEEMRSVELLANKDLTVYLRDPNALMAGMIANRIALDADKPYSWSLEKDPSNPFAGRRATVYVINPTDSAVKLRVVGATREEYPQVAIVPITAAALVGVVLLYLAMHAVMPKVMAVASITGKEAVAQPLFQVLMVIGAFVLIAFIYIPYNTFGEDVKMLKMGALEWIMVLGILVAAWSASVSISEEIEGRTALTVLSKPIGRIQFILGKFFGVLQAVSLLFLFLGVLFLVTVSYKVVYDVRESVLTDATWADCYDEMIGVAPGLALAFMETVVITAISVAIATRLPLLPNLLISFSIYLLGNLAPMLVQARLNDPYGIVKFVGQLFALVLPVLENFNIQAALSAGVPVSAAYLGWALVYCVLYCAIAMLVALLLFEDRDLA